MELAQHQEQLLFETPGRGLRDISSQVQGVLTRSGLKTGQVSVFCRHTSASLVLAENADPSASSDLMAWLERQAPDGDPIYRHSAEGPDDMPAHLRTALLSSSECIPFQDARLLLGTWQGLFLVEHRTAPHRRQVVVHVLGQA